MNQLIVDSFAMTGQSAPSIPSTEFESGADSKAPTGPTTVPAPANPAWVDLLLIVSRQLGPQSFVRVAATHPQQPAGVLTRDMKKVPPPPDQVRLRTGERVRIEVVADKKGYVTVFNVGPTGNMNLLYPDADLQPDSEPRPIEPYRPLHILDVEMTPPAGRERLFAVWSRQPLRVEQLAGLADQGGASKLIAPLAT